MDVVADLHLHSKYSRAVSQQMVIPEMVKWAKKKGINLLGTGDFTHPLWFRELKESLVEENGLLRMKEETEEGGEVRLLLTTEVSSIYSQGGKVRKIHNLIAVPSFTLAEKINQELTRRGGNLLADGRPIVGLSAKEILSLVMEIDENALVIPCHIWTPHFSLFGANSGFDSLEECFGNLSKYIFGVETGLSSDPEMNWSIPDLESKTIVSFSDAHSGVNLGREMTVLEIETPTPQYEDVRKAIVGGSRGKIKYTVEFYPEEGKYHYTGHRKCGVVQSPEESEKKGTTCPVCGRPLTVGVMHRVRELAKNMRNLKIDTKSDESGLKWIISEKGTAFVKLVPLIEIIAESQRVGKLSQSVLETYENLIGKLGSELEILTRIELEKIASIGGERLAEGVKKVRSGDILIKPGYDGEYGTVMVWPSSVNLEKGTGGKGGEQISLFG